MYIQRIVFVLSFLVLFNAFGERSYTAETVPDPKKNGGGYVSNPDGIISKESVSTLNNSLSRIDNSGQAQIAVVVLGSIGDKVPKDFAVALFNLWGLGDKEKDNGLLVLIVNDQHRIEFETGYGLEAVLTDATCKKIQLEQMIPYAKQGNLDQALSYGISAVEEILNNAMLWLVIAQMLKQLMLPLKKLRTSPLYGVWEAKFLATCMVLFSFQSCHGFAL